MQHKYEVQCWLLRIPMEEGPDVWKVHTVHARERLSTVLELEVRVQRNSQGLKLVFLCRLHVGTTAYLHAGLPAIANLFARSETPKRTFICT